MAELRFLSLEGLIARLEIAQLNSGLQVPNNNAYFAETLDVRRECAAHQEHQNRGNEHASSQLVVLPHEVSLNARTPNSLIYDAATRSAPLALLASLRGDTLPYWGSFFLEIELPFPLAYQIQRAISVPPIVKGSEFHKNTPIELIDSLIAIYAEHSIPNFRFCRRGACSKTTNSSETRMAIGLSPETCSCVLMHSDI